ncbi:MAG: DUF6526 family protein [Sphingobacteriales bacterium]
MKKQNYSNHHRWVPGYHFVLSSLLIIGTLVAAVNALRHMPNTGGFISAVLIENAFACGLLLFWYSRQFPLKVQDRAIRAEENLRYYSLTGKLLDDRLNIRQIIALRFAPDDEFLELVDKALNENLAPEDIKMAVKEWKADHHRA